ncbi:hypothetical protein SSS_00421 [Sarcoptes scabiei]|uniref:CUB domain-containing protein n=1 Tax=Sarcoptes scabiei TaxID=52283 RepID=A0A834RA67_SARSC|nr:hypothetical protein SSS_00421 [Sarcoptes scabiei]
MLRFEKLALDCNDHLYIYDGAHTIGNHKADLSCRSTRAEVGTIYTQSNFLTLRYTTDAYSKADNGFRLIITAYKDSKNYCREHRCANQYCISRDLVCDGVNHCGDSSDEHYFVHCQATKTTTTTTTTISYNLYTQPDDTIIGLDPILFIAIVSSVFVSCLACIISVAFCLCRRERLIQQQQQQQQQQQFALQQQQYQLHDTGHHLGTTPLMTSLHHHPNNINYGTKFDGACTMITSLDYGPGGGLATTLTRNGGLVNSYTHSTIPNTGNTVLIPNNPKANVLANSHPTHFSTLPHPQPQLQLQHNHLMHQASQAHQPTTISHQGSPIVHHPLGSLQSQQQQQQQQQLRFATLPNSTVSKSSPPPYPGNGINNNGLVITSSTASSATTNQATGLGRPSFGLLASSVGTPTTGSNVLMQSTTTIGQ